MCIRDRSITEFLKDTNQIEHAVVTANIHDLGGKLFGEVSIGSWDPKHLRNKSDTDPVWTPMEFLPHFGGTRGGWVFGVSAIMVGDDVPLFFNSNKTVLRTMLLHEKDIGYNYVTNNRSAGTEFMNMIETKFKSIRPSCRQINATENFEVFSCTFLL